MSKFLFCLDVIICYVSLWERLLSNSNHNMHSKVQNVHSIYNTKKQKITYLFTIIIFKIKTIDIHVNKKCT